MARDGRAANNDRTQVFHEGLDLAQATCPCLMENTPDHDGYGQAYPFTHTTCFSVCTTSTRSRWAAMTASMSL